MIQGLRLLPHVADVPIFDCDKCRHGDKKMNLQPQPISVRRAQACGFLPHDPKVKRAWGVPAGVDFVPGEGDPDARDFRPLCPGYLVSLPEVREAVQLRPHWLKGAIGLYLRGCDGDLTQAFNCQAILDGAVTQKQIQDSEEAAAKAKEQGHGQ